MNALPKFCFPYMPFLIAINPPYSCAGAVFLLLPRANHFFYFTQGAIGIFNGILKRNFIYITAFEALVILWGDGVNDDGHLGKYPER